MSIPIERQILKRAHYEETTPRTSKKLYLSTTPKEVFMQNEEAERVLDEALKQIPQEHRALFEGVRASIAETAEKIKAYDPEMDTIATSKRADMLTFSPHLPHAYDCNECKRRITGRLFECFECDNYHLCHECERAGHHVEHPMLRLGHPQTPRVERAEGTKRRRESCRETSGNEMRTNSRTYCSGGND